MSQLWYSTNRIINLELQKILSIIHCATGNRVFKAALCHTDIIMSFLSKADSV